MGYGDGAFMTNGWGIYGLKGWGIYGLNGWGIYGWGIYGLNGWGSYGKVSCCFFGRYAQKMLVFRGVVPFPVLA